MNYDRITINSLESTLGSIFDAAEWTPLQYQSYVMLRHHVNNFKETSKKYEIREDRSIIRNNFKDQLWFIYSKAKPLMSHLLDAMILEHYICDDNEYSTNYMLVIAFGTFNLHACFYKNKVNNFLNYYIFFENKSSQRAYLSYYTVAMGAELTDAIKRLKLPEFDKIYEVTNLNPQIFYQYDLLNFFAEIVMYYDESGLIGDTLIGNNTQVTFNQLIVKYNAYIHQKNSDSGYLVINNRPMMPVTLK